MARGIRPQRHDKQRRDELLSAYIDGELNARERARIEARLAEDGALRAELAAMRRAVALVRDLPSRPAPRNFLLPQSMASKPRPAPVSRATRRWVAPFLTAATAAASLLFLVVLVGDLMFAGAGAHLAETQKLGAPADEAPVEEMEQLERVAETPPVTLQAEREQATTEAQAGAVEPTTTPAGEGLPAATEAAFADAGGGEEETRAAPPSPAATQEPGEKEAVESSAEAPQPTPRSGPTPTAPPAPGEVLSEEDEAEGETPRAYIVTQTRAPAPGAEEPEASDTSLSRGEVLWLVLEIGLGAIALALAVAAVLAWRTRR